MAERYRVCVKPRAAFADTVFRAARHDSSPPLGGGVV
jgi:hypothetical protein